MALGADRRVSVRLRERDGRARARGDDDLRAIVAQARPRRIGIRRKREQIEFLRNGLREQMRRKVGVHRGVALHDDAAPAKRPGKIHAQRWIVAGADALDEIRIAGTEPAEKLEQNAVFAAASGRRFASV